MNAALELNPAEKNVQARPPDFDRLAPFYRWMEWFSFGPLLGQCRSEFLPEMKTQRTALILGDGDGRFTARLLKETPFITVDAVDASAAMLRRLQRRSNPYAGRLQIHHIDARQFRPSHCFDLIVTHFFLDCLSTGELSQLAMQIRRRSAARAKWVISEFALPERTLCRILARPLISTLYWAFGWLTGLQVRRLPDHRSALRRAGFRLLQHRNRLGGLLVSELWQAES